MTSKEALERIKSKYKGCLVKEAHELPFSYDINIDNIEEYWHIENKNDFSQIEKDLEILEILKEALYVHKTNAKDLLELRAIFDLETYDEEERQKNQKIKEWLENVN